MNRNLPIITHRGTFRAHCGRLGDPQVDCGDPLRWLIATKHKTTSFPGSLSSASLVIGRRPSLQLVMWPPVTQTFPPGQSRRIIFVDLNWSERQVTTAGHRYMYIKPHMGKYCSTPLKFSSPFQRFTQAHTGQMKYIYISSILKYLSLWFLLVDLLRSKNCFALSCCLN